MHAHRVDLDSATATVAALRFVPAALVALALLASACGPVQTDAAPQGGGDGGVSSQGPAADGDAGQGSPDAAVSISVTISPAQLTLPPGGEQDFTAFVYGATDQTLDWTVSEKSGGTISREGHYKAPGAEGTFHVRAAAHSDPGKTATATVTVVRTQPIVVSVSPAVVTLSPREQHKFDVSVTGSPDERTTWSVDGSAASGTIDAEGIYTAPAQPGTYHVRARSVADPSKSAAAEARVVALPEPVTIAITPAAVDLKAGGTQQFTATVKGGSDQQVGWSIVEGDGGGALTTSGMYTAPGQAGTYHVVARSFADPSRTATAEVRVTVPPAVSIAIDPASATLLTGEQKKFTAQVQNATDVAVLWSLQELDGGSVAADGTYTAPGKPGTYHVIASSKADASKTATATVTVNPRPPPIQLIVRPGAVSLGFGAAQQFEAVVTGTTNTAVKWSLNPAGAGTITASGLYTAPSTAGAVSVVAVSDADPSAKAEAVVTVAQSLSVSIDPPTVNDLGGGQSSFVATVSGSANQEVTWSLQEGAAAGAVSSAGVYSEPDVSGTFHVVATSKADPRATATATVNLTAHKDLVVLVRPDTASAAPGGSIQFSAQVSGPFGEVVGAGLSWSVQEPGGGSIGVGRTDFGLYLAPQTPGTYHVVGKVAGGNRGIATVTVVAPPVTLEATITPKTVTLAPQATQQFSATVKGASQPGVAWSVTETGGGGVSGSGLYTAPATPGTYHVEVVATAPGTAPGRATAEVIVQPAVKVTLTAAPGTDPRLNTAKDTFSLGKNSSIQLVALVEGVPDQSVAWSIDEQDPAGVVGTVRNGLYVSANPPLYVHVLDAPPPPGIVHVRATSRADPSASAAVTIDHNLFDNGGPVMPESNLYQIWWGNRADFPADEIEGMTTLLKGFEGSDYLKLTKQYMRGADVHAVYRDSFFDGTAPPESLDLYGTEILAEVCRVIAANNIPRDAKNFFFVYVPNFPKNVGGCAWHTWGSCDVPGDPGFAFSFVPNAAADPGHSCIGANVPPPACPPHSLVVDMTANHVTHELIEGITDPQPVRGWADSKEGLGEIGDKCAWTFAGCQNIGGTSWQVQLAWSNQAKSCAAK